MKQVLIIIIFIVSPVVFAEENQNDQDDIDLTLINEVTYDLSKPIFGTRPTLGRGLRDMQNSSGGSACTSCAH